MSIVFREFPSPAALEDMVCSLLTAEFTRHARQPFGIMLAGGATPLAVYRRLARQPIYANPKLHVLFTDDRLVPPDSPGSNFGNAKPMLSRLGLTAERLLRVRTELPLAEAAADYDTRLRTFLAEGTITLGLLGLGADGHTCSIYTPVAAEIRDRLAFPVEETAGFARVTVSAAVLDQVQRLIFLVTGVAKRAVIERLRATPESLAAGVAVRQHPRVELWTDVPLAD